ncbi:MAG: preprotein translocase subunit SecE [Candidatus Moranbacteria bacterium]|nr:preprotein translocase subunit SecE [Candidatus Moranbacteria bacterium]
MQAILTFLREAKVELLRVNWPSQKEVARYTFLVVVMSLTVAIFLGSLDFLFGFLVERYLLQ